MADTDPEAHGAAPSDAAAKPGPLNRLARSTSPYLLQHAANPVDWHEWGAEALDLARSRDVPILLSIGYSACHWCHVMAHESFEDPELAAYVNEHFVAIKVDREERPDIDAIYMEAVQAMTGHGGWPLTAFLDTRTRPFYCGTYFPPEPRSGLPSFRMVLEAVVASWGSDRERLEAGAERISERIRAGSGGEAAAELPGRDQLEAAVAALLAQADPVAGGFGGAPKFPPASALELLLTRGGREATEVCELTLDAIAAGGIRDQLGGGFARYSVDGRWLVPHFEKMLYDNALLARAYLHGWQALGHVRWREVCESTLDWLAAEMRGPEGGFHSALDADSEGEEGRFYVWEQAELREVLEAAGLDSSEIAAIEAHWGVTEAGNFEGRNILNLPGGLEAPAPERLDAARAALLERRAGRPRPGLDDKRICAWNALAIAAFADAGAVWNRTDYLAVARTAADFVLTEMRVDGRLRRSWKDGRAPIGGYLEDHAAMLEALLTLYEATFERRWLDEARALAEVLLAEFEDTTGQDSNSGGASGGFHTTPHDAEPLIARRKDFDDHPAPSGNSAAALGLLRLAALTGEGRYRAAAERVLRLAGPIALRFPSALAHMLRALDFALEPVDEVAIVTDPAAANQPAGSELVAAVRARFRPRTVVAAGPEGSEIPELLAGRSTVDDQAAAYVCRSFSCRRPVTSAAELAAELGDTEAPDAADGISASA